MNLLCATRNLTLVSVSFGLALFASAAQADWPGFLGPAGNPVSASSVPLDFQVKTEDTEAKNIAWRIPLAGRAVCGPIVVDGKVITTSSSAMEERWMDVTAVDAENGEVVWRRSTKCTGRPFCHPTSANAAPTPCTDGEYIYVFFSSNDVVCYDLDGNLQWFKSLVSEHPLAGNDLGMAASPCVVDGVLVVSVECQADSFTAGIACDSGETLWEVSRPASSNWSTPRAMSDETGSVVVLQGNSLLGINAKTGDKVWEIDQDCSTIVTCVFKDKKLYVPAGGLQVYEFESVLKEPKEAWKSTRISPNSSSMLITDYGVIGLNRAVLACCDTEGDRKWNARLEDAGQFWSTPVIAGEHLYAFDSSGKCFIVKVAEDGAEVVRQRDLGADVLGSPAVSGNALFVRSVDALWKISAN
ncbi:MAG: PQQ-binding-like beta-propeller repeat protein [Planctomycetota bacterium]